VFLRLPGVLSGPAVHPAVKRLRILRVQHQKVRTPALDNNFLPPNMGRVKLSGKIETRNSREVSGRRAPTGEFGLGAKLTGPIVATVAKIHKIPSCFDAQIPRNTTAGYRRCARIGFGQRQERRSLA
jgi:hypothetical protein